MRITGPQFLQILVIVVLVSPKPTDCLSGFGKLESQIGLTRDVLLNFLLTLNEGTSKWHSAHLTFSLIHIAALFYENMQTSYCIVHGFHLQGPGFHYLSNFSKVFAPVYSVFFSGALQVIKYTAYKRAMQQSTKWAWLWYMSACLYLALFGI